MRIWWLLVVACGSSSTKPQQSLETTEQPLSNRTEPAEAPFSSIAGEWSGRGFQPDIQADWMVVMNIDANAPVGARVGTISYPDLGCSGELRRLASPPEQLHAREHLTVNPVQNDELACIDGGTVVVPAVPRTEDGLLEWKWLYPDGRPGATATLAR